MVEERARMWMRNPGSFLESYLNISSLLEIAVDSLLQKSDCFSDKDVVLLAAQFNASVKTNGSDKEGTSIINRLEQLEAAMLVGQDTKQTIQDPTRNITSCTDEAHTIPLKLQEEMRKLSNEQNLKIEKLTKQLQEQSQSIKAMDNEIKCLKEREYSLNKTVEKLSQDVEECKTNSDKINKEMQVQTDKTLCIIEEIKNHSGLIYAFQQDGNKLAFHTESQLQKLFLKYGVVCQIFQQRMCSVDKLIQTFNRNQADGSRSLRVTQPSLGARSFVMPQMMNPTTGCVASRGYRTKYSNIISFTQVESNVGNHFNPITGFFNAPSNSSYMVVIAIRQTGNQSVKVEVKRTILYHRQEVVGQVYTTQKGEEVSNTFVVGLFPGDTLWAATDSFECECTYFSCLRQ